MKIKCVIIVFLVILVAMTGRSYAQTGLTGSWSGKLVEGKNEFKVTLQLEMKGKLLSGTYTEAFTESNQQGCEFENGKVEGRLFSFECEMTNGDNTFKASYEGFINSKGGEITVSPQKPTNGNPVTLTRAKAAK